MKRLKVMNMKKQSSKKKDPQGVVEEIGNKVEEFTKEYGTKRNIFKALGILGGLGAVTFLAIKYVPWNKVMDTLEENLEKLEDSFNETFKEESVSGGV
jgi:hypothetical protein